MVSHPETSSDSPIGSDRESGRDTNCAETSGAEILFLLFFLELLSENL